VPKHHVIIGGGPAATCALETIRGIDQGQSRITLICDEPAHSRMALPYWLAGEISREQTMTADDDYYRRLGVEAHIGSRVRCVDPGQKRLTLDDGAELEFDDLLIATGSSASGLPVPGAELPNVLPLWTLVHSERVLAVTQRLKRPRVALVGAGFIGCIVLNAMHKRGWQLTLIERDDHILPRMLNPRAAEVAQEWLARNGISVRTGVNVRQISPLDDGACCIELNEGIRIEVDLVILATGIQPNLDCVRGADIEIEQGIRVNDRMQTLRYPFIYAAGDVAQGPVLFQAEPQVHAIQPTAVDHGRIAGANMAGRAVRYPGSLLVNVLEMCGLQCASFGNWADPAAEAVTISDGPIYRRLLWSGDELTGAVFTGRANDLGMLTDLGMVKGILQTRTRLSGWKEFLRGNPFDIRRPYVATGVAAKLAGTTLLGAPSRPRRFQFSGSEKSSSPRTSHAVFMNTRGTSSGNP
jgi:NAD(P)H-nitrite reductase large subunit